jgi:predicted ArsR family transcriptional regulator
MAKLAALGRRQRKVLALIARHGVVDTEQAAVVLAVSRPTAHRLLDGLWLDGWVDRSASRHGRDHRWYYAVSGAGAENHRDGAETAGRTGVGLVG